MRSLGCLLCVALACGPGSPGASETTTEAASMGSSSTAPSTALPTSTATHGSNGSSEAETGDRGTGGLETSSASGGEVETGSSEGTDGSTGDETGGVESLCEGLVTLVVDGFIELHTPEDKAALAGVECLVGDLLLFPGIGDASGLESLRLVTGDVVATADVPAPAAAIFVGLDKLERIGGDLLLFWATVHTFTGLESLRRVDGDVETFMTSLDDVHGLEGLEEIGGGLLLGNCWGEGDEEKSMSQVPSLAGLAGLRTIGGVLNVTSTELVELALPGLETVGLVLVCHATALVSVSLPSLTETNGILFDHFMAYPELAVLELPKLTSVQGDVSLVGTQLVDLAGLAAFESVDGSLRLVGNSQLPTCTAEAFADGVMVGEDVEVEGNLADACGG